MAGVRTTPRNDAVMHLRLPAALLADIRRLAAANHRSANAEVRHHVIEAIVAHDAARHGRSSGMWIDTPPKTSNGPALGGSGTVAEATPADPAADDDDRGDGRRDQA